MPRTRAAAESRSACSLALGRRGSCWPSRVRAGDGDRATRSCSAVFADGGHCLRDSDDHQPQPGVFGAVVRAGRRSSVCGLFLLQSAPFLAAATVIVYAGAIVVTFVFVIMLAQQSGATVYDQRSRQPLLATVVAFLLLGALLAHAASRRQPDDLACARRDSRRVDRPAKSAQSPAENEQPMGTMHGARPVAVRRLPVRGRTGRHAAAWWPRSARLRSRRAAAGDAMTGDVERYLAVGAVLFVLGALGFFTRRNLIVMMLSAEMMLHGVSLTLVTFGRMHHSFEGQAFTIFILTVAACEAGLALSLILALYQKSKSLDIELWTDLREPDLPSPDVGRGGGAAAVRRAGADATSRG